MTSQTKMRVKDLKSVAKDLHEQAQRLDELAREICDHKNDDDSWALGGQHTDSSCVFCGESGCYVPEYKEQHLKTFGNLWGWIPKKNEKLKRGTCQDCGIMNDLITKGDHHGGMKTVCVDRNTCNRRSPG